MAVLTEPVDPSATSPRELLGRYADRVAEAAADIPPEAVTDHDSLDGSALESAAAGRATDLTLEAAVSILALARGEAPAAGIAAVRDHLLLSMSGAVMDVESLAAAVEADLEPGEVQAMVEGRLPMTLDQYARLHHAIARGAR